MAYTDDILALSPDHLHAFNNTLTDTGSVGTNVWTNTGTVFSAVPTSRDTDYSLLMDGTSDILNGTSVATTNGTPTKQIAFWFRCSAIQGPPTLVYAEGGATTGLAFILWAGNNIMLQIWDNLAYDLKQVYCNTPLTINRNYHISIKYEDNTGGDFVEFYIDGILQPSSNTNGGLGVTLTAYTGVPHFGRFLAGDIPVGDGSCLLVSPVNGYVSNWCSWVTPPTFSNFYNDVFGRGAIPEYTITSNSEANMQTQLDVLADTVCGDYPLSILVNPYEEGGDLNLTADNITFSNLASSHVRYDGSGTLYWTNSGTSEASISHGNVSFINPAVLTIEGLINGSEVRLYDNENTSDSSYNTELSGTESNSGTSYIFNHDGSVNNIVIQVLADGYEEIEQEVTLSSDNQTVTLFPKVEENA